MTRSQRLIPLALAAIVVVVALVVIPGNSDDDGPRATTTTTPPARTATASAPARPAPPAARVERIRLRNGRPLGGVRTLAYDSGEVVRLAISSNVDDDIHVHGYDQTVRIPAGKTRRLRFKADAEGIFEIESHNTHQAVARLEVRP